MRVKQLENQVKEYEGVLSEKTGEFISKKDIVDLRQKIDRLTNENISYKKINEGQTTKFLKEKSRSIKESNKLTSVIKEQVPPFPTLPI